MEPPPPMSPSEKPTRLPDSVAAIADDAIIDDPGRHVGSRSPSVMHDHADRHRSHEHPDFGSCRGSMKRWLGQDRNRRDPSRCRTMPHR